jgi:transcriptional regulator with XRE-family HTH domain
MHRMDIRKQIGVNIRRKRDALGLSQEALAHESGIHRTYISGLERGIRNPTVTIIQAIASALKVRPSELLEETPK